MESRDNRLMVFGAGYLGSRVARQALAASMGVGVLTRDAASADALEKEGARPVIVTDLAGDDWHNAVEPSYDLVLNCVASGKTGLEGYRRSYFEGMRSILSWASSGRIGTLVYTSSTGVYADADGAEVDETARLASANPAARVLIETESLLSGCDHGIGRWFILRLAGLYGPRRHWLLDTVRSGKPFPGKGESHVNLVHVDDAAAAVWAAFGAPPGVRNEIFNVVDDMPARKKEIVAWLAKEEGLPEPAWNPALPESRRLSAGKGGRPADRRIVNAKVKEVLGWRPGYPTFREGFRAAAGQA